MKRLVLTVMCLMVLTFVAGAGAGAKAATPNRSDSGPMVTAGTDGGKGLGADRCQWKMVCSPCRRLCRRVRRCSPTCRLGCQWAAAKPCYGPGRKCITKHTNWRCVMLRTYPPRCRALSTPVRWCRGCVNGIYRQPVKVCYCSKRSSCSWVMACGDVCPQPRCRRVRVCR